MDSNGPVYIINGDAFRYCGGTMDAVGRCLRCGRHIETSGGCTALIYIDPRGVGKIEVDDGNKASGGGS